MFVLEVAAAFLVIALVSVTLWRLSDPQNFVKPQPVQRPVCSLT